MQIVKDLPPDWPHILATLPPDWDEILRSLPPHWLVTWRQLPPDWTDRMCYEQVGGVEDTFACVAVDMIV